MNEAKSQTRPIGSGRGSSDLMVVGIHFNPGPDAQDRLRRSPDDDPVNEDWSVHPRTPAAIDNAATPSPAHDYASEELGPSSDR